MDSDIVVPVALFFSVAWIIVSVTRSISDGYTRRRLIEAGATSELVHAVTIKRKDPGLYSALKWGFVVGAVGLALILIQFLPFDQNDPFTFGLIFVFGAGGLLWYYMVAKRITARDPQLRSRTA